MRRIATIGLAIVMAAAGASLAADAPAKQVDVKARKTCCARAAGAKAQCPKAGKAAKGRCTGKAKGAACTRCPKGAKAAKAGSGCAGRCPHAAAKAKVSTGTKVTCPARGARKAPPAAPVTG